MTAQNIQNTNAASVDTATNTTTNALVNTLAEQDSSSNGEQIIFLHHSTGQNVWDGGVSAWFDEYNASHGTAYAITEQAFPKDSPYGWENYPYDYWNIWVNHAGAEAYQEEPTLETLTQEYDVIVWKHCFPVSDIEPDTGSPSVDSSDKTLENYKLQYGALRAKMLTFPNTTFIVWTGSAQVEGAMSAEQAERANGFAAWVRDEWDVRGDNIFVWDFRSLETGGGLYLKSEYAASSDDSHPNETFSTRVAPLLGQRIVDAIEGRGDSGSITGGTL